MDSLASELCSASLPDEQMQALMRSPTGGRATWPGLGGSRGSGGGSCGSVVGSLFGLAVGLLGGGLNSSPKRSTPAGTAAGAEPQQRTAGA